MNDRTEKIRLIVEETLNENILGTIASQIGAGAGAVLRGARAGARSIRDARFTRELGSRLDPFRRIKSELANSYQDAVLAHSKYERAFVESKIKELGAVGTPAHHASAQAYAELARDPGYRILTSRLQKAKEASTKPYSTGIGRGAGAVAAGAIALPFKFGWNITGEGIKYAATRPLQLAMGADSASVGVGRGLGPAQSLGDQGDFSRINR